MDWVSEQFTHPVCNLGTIPQIPIYRWLLQQLPQLGLLNLIQQRLSTWILMAFVA
jgi:hypothetical protein